MSYRRSQARRAKQEKISDWAELPDTVFTDLGVDRETLAAFEHALIGSILLPGEADYDAASRATFQISTDRPKIIVYCEIENDIRLCLAWARRHKWWVVARSGGHSTAAFSVNNEMVIDVSRMNHVAVDPEAKQVRVGAGTNFGRLNAALDSHKLHVPGGLCEDVGIAGYMQGGGYGLTVREFGLNCDNVVSFRMMLRDGRTVTANASQNADLYWAVRGSTGNNFGILLDITYRLHDLWKLWALGIRWEVEDAAAVLCCLQQHYMRTGASPKLGYIVIISHRADLDGRPVLMLRATYNGSRADGEMEIAKLLKIGNPTVEIDSVETYFRVETLLYERPHQVIDCPADPDLKEDKQAGFISKTVSQRDWQTIIDYYVATSPAPYNAIVIEPYGGAISAIAADDCAYVHRDVDMDFYVDSFWIEDADADAAIAWLDGFMDLMASHFSGGVYQNYPRRGLSDYKRRYWGANYDRLLAVKQKYDPVPHMFYFEQGICTAPDDPGEPLDGGVPADLTSDPIVFEPDAASAGEAEAM